MNTLNLDIDLRGKSRIFTTMNRIQAGQPTQEGQKHQKEHDQPSCDVM